MRSLTVCLLLAAGCGGGGGNVPPPPGDMTMATGNTVNGTVKGQTLDAKDGVAVTGGQALEIIVGDRTSLCTALTQNSTPKSATLLIITIAHYTTGGMATFPTPGDYTITALAPPDNSNSGQVQFNKHDASCMIDQTNSSIATGGTVHLTAASSTGSGHSTGTFDLTFGTDHITGSFDGALCNTVGQNNVCQ